VKALPRCRLTTATGFGEWSFVRVAPVLDHSPDPTADISWLYSGG